MALRNFTITGTNGTGQRVGIDVKASDKFAADKLASKLLSTPNSRGKETFTRWDTKEIKK